MTPGRLTVPPPLTVMLLPLNDVSPAKLGDPPSIAIDPPAYEVSWAVAIVEVPSVVRFTPDKLARAPSSTVPPLVAWRVEVVQPLASVKPVKAEMLSTLLAPSASRMTVPVLMVLRAERVTVPPARASNCDLGLVVVGGSGSRR